MKGLNSGSSRDIFSWFSLLESRLWVLSYATKRKNVAHVQARLRFIKKLKKSFRMSYLTAYTKNFMRLLCFIFFGVKVLFGVDLKNKFEWADAIALLTTVTQSWSDRFFVKILTGHIALWDRCYLLVLYIEMQSFKRPFQQYPWLFGNFLTFLTTSVWKITLSRSFAWFRRVIPYQFIRWRVSRLSTIHFNVMSLVKQGN